MSRYAQILETGEVNILNLETLEDLQGVVGGRIEPIPVPLGASIPQTLTVYGNYEARVVDMNINVLATRILNFSYPLVGPVIIGGPVDDEGGATSLPAAWASYLQSLSVQIVVL